MNRVKLGGFSLFFLAALAVLGCPGNQELEVAVLVPETGPWSSYGVEIRRGVEVALDHLAESSGADVAKITWLDTKSDPATAKRLLEEAFQGSAYAAIGGVTSAEAAQMVPVAEAANKVLISPSASDPALTAGGGRYFYRVIPSDFDEGTRMAKFAHQDLKLESVADLVAQSHFGATSEQFFRAAFEAEGGKALGPVEYPASGADWDAVARQAIALQPQGIYLADFADGISSMIRALRAAGFEGAVLTSSAFSDPAAVARVRSDGVYLTRVGFDASADTPLVQAFVQKYQEKHGEKPSLFAALGFDSMLVMAESLSKVDGDQANRFWQKLRSLSDFQGVTGSIQFDESGDVQKFPQIFLIQDGELISFTAWQADAKRRREELMRRMEELQRKQRSLGGNG